MSGGDDADGDEPEGDAPSGDAPASGAAGGDTPEVDTGEDQGTVDGDFGGFDSHEAAMGDPETAGISGRGMSDGGTMTDTGTGTGAGAGAGVGTGETVEEYEGPPDDEEMPLADHIEEMVRRVLVVVVVMSAVSVVVLPFSDELINFVWYSILGAASAGGDNLAQPKVYNPLALVLARLKTATLAGFVVALPVFVYETYLFMRPGLYPQERRYYLAAVPTSLVLATIGVAFAFFLVLPGLFIYFLYYSQDAAFIAFGLTDTYGLMLLLMGFFAVIFQIPLFIMLAIMMGVTSRRWLVERRLYFWGAFLGIAFLFSPDPTGMAPIIVAATMVALFEGTLLLLKWTGRGDSGRMGPTT